MIPIKPINNLLTIRASIFLLIILPAMPPRIPQSTIPVNSDSGKSGIVLVTKLAPKLNSCDNNMIYNEF